MTLSTLGISNALGQRLATLDPRPLIVWENRRPRDANGTPYETIPAGSKPYLDVEVIEAMRDDPTMKGGGTRGTAEGYLQVIAVSQVDSWAVAGRQLIDRVRAVFPKGLRLPVFGGGTVEITGNIHAVPGFPDGDDWREGVRIVWEGRR